MIYKNQFDIDVDSLNVLIRRFEEVERELCSNSVISDHNLLQKLSKEHKNILPVVEIWRKFQNKLQEFEDANLLLSDKEFHDAAEFEISSLKLELSSLEQELRFLLLPKDQNDERNIILEVRSGEGGEEAALFAANIFRMIVRYTDSKHWNSEILNLSEASGGGIKEVTALITGENVFSFLRFEGGVHRVQRVPETETQGRIHTSTATVLVLPEADEVDISIDEKKDLEISIAASGGPGGQGVNTTNSAVQIRHIPTGIIVKCQDERSQLKNKAKAMKVLRSRLLELEQKKHDASISAERKNMVGSAERSSKIRTYNYPQNRVTDHRIGLTLHKLDKIMDGDLEEIILALRNHRQVELMKMNKI